MKSYITAEKRLEAWMSEREKIGSVSIFIHGDNLNPQEITKFLGVQPSEHRKMGEERRLRHGTVTRARTGVWTLSQPLFDDDVSAALENIFHSLGENFHSILGFPGVDSAYADIFLCIDPEKADAGHTVRFSSSVAKIAASAGIDIQITTSIDR